MQKNFEPDASLVSAVAASLNFDARQGDAPDMILLHYTGMESAEAALARLLDPAAKVSSHYFVHEDGRVLQLVPEARRAWHAGEALWDGERDINSRSIGIEIVNPGHDFAIPDFPRADRGRDRAVPRHHQAKCIRRPRARPFRRGTAAQAGSGRNSWDLLHKKGVGHLVAPRAAHRGPALKPGDRGEAVTMLQTMLARYGYGLPVTGEFDATTAVWSRHSSATSVAVRVDGIADASTVATLARSAGRAPDLGLLDAASLPHSERPCAGMTIRAA
jgi:N-acetylmuramoyl-L-alanine amidase